MVIFMLGLWIIDLFILFYLSVAYGHRDTTVLMHVMGPKLLVLKARESSFESERNRISHIYLS